MFKNIILICFILIVPSCSNKAEIDKLLELQKEVESLKIENNELLSKNEKLTQSVDSLILINKKSIKKDTSIKTTEKSLKYFSESQAIEYVEDYYDFYNADHKAENIRVRRISNNVFKVSLSDYHKAFEHSKESMSRNLNYTLTIKEGGNYTMKLN